MTLNPDKIRKQDGNNIIAWISQNEVGRDLAWNFVEKNFKKLLDM